MYYFKMPMIKACAKKRLRRYIIFNFYPSLLQVICTKSVLYGTTLFHRLHSIRAPFFFGWPVNTGNREMMQSH